MSELSNGKDNAKMIGKVAQTKTKKSKKGFVISCISAVVIIAVMASVYGLLSRNKTTDVVSCPERGLFSEGLTPVEKDSKWGYINEKGEMVIHPKFDSAMSFSEGLAQVRQDGKMNFIDKKGNVVFDTQFRSVDFFSEGLACVENDEGKCGYIDLKGNYIIDPKFVSAMPFINGVAPVSSMVQTDDDDKASLKWGIIDKEGKELVPIRYDDIYCGADGEDVCLEDGYFSDGLLAVKSGDEWGYINEKGNMVIAPQFDEALAFSDGMAIVLQGKKWGYINLEGEYVIQPTFKSAFRFSEGLACVENDDGKWGYVDLKGNYVISPQFVYAGAFVDGVAVVNSEHKYGIINEKGNYVTQPIYDHISAIGATGKFWATQDSMLCILNHSGNVEKTLSYKKIENYSFKDGYAICATDNKKVVIINGEGVQVGEEYEGVCGGFYHYCKTGECFEQVFGSDNYCLVHKCGYSWCENFVSNEGATFCSEHECKIEDCHSKIAEEVSEYCKKHECDKFACHNKTTADSSYCEEHRK